MSLTSLPARVPALAPPEGRPDDRPEPTPISARTRLTRRQREVLELVAAGCSNQAVARHLRVTEHTVEGHLNQIFTKLELEPRPDSNRRVLAVLRWLAA